MTFVQQWQALQMRLVKLQAENNQMRACLEEQIKLKQQQLEQLRRITELVRKLKSKP